MERLLIRLLFGEVRLSRIGWNCVEINRNSVAMLVSPQESKLLGDSDVLKGIGSCLKDSNFNVTLVFLFDKDTVRKMVFEYKSEKVFVEEAPAELALPAVRCGVFIEDLITKESINSELLLRELFNGFTLTTMIEDKKPGSDVIFFKNTVSGEEDAIALENKEAKNNLLQWFVKTTPKDSSEHGNKWIFGKECTRIAIRTGMQEESTVVISIMCVEGDRFLLTEEETAQQIIKTTLEGILLKVPRIDTGLNPYYATVQVSKESVIPELKGKLTHLLVIQDIQSPYDLLPLILSILPDEIKTKQEHRKCDDPRPLSCSSSISCSSSTSEEITPDFIRDSIGSSIADIFAHSPHSEFQEKVLEILQIDVSSAAKGDKRLDVLKKQVHDEVVRCLSLIASGNRA